MKKEYKFTGSMYGASTITLKDDKIVIHRQGICSFLNHGLKGDKTINIRSITGTQYKACGIANGYLQFIIMGSQETKGGLSAAQKDENTVVWAHKKCNKLAQEIIQYIEKYNSLGNNNTGNVYNINNKQDDKYDKLDKIKRLLNDGVLTQEEFQEEKTKILND